MLKLKRSEDHQGKKIYLCLNHMVTSKEIFSKLFQIYQRLGEVGIDDGTPITLLVHGIRPNVQYLNQSKTKIF